MVAEVRLYCLLTGPPVLPNLFDSDNSRIEIDPKHDAQREDEEDPILVFP